MNLTEQLSNFYMQKRNQQQLGEIAVDNAAVVSLDARGRSWMRCKITKIMDNYQAEVLCVDHGESKVVAVSSLKCLKFNFSEPPAFAMECQLSHLRFSLDDERLERIKNLFEFFKKSNYRVHIKTTGVLKTSKIVHSVVLYFINDSFKLNFNAILSGLKLTTTNSASLMNDYVTVYNTEANEKVFEVDSIDESSDPAGIRLTRNVQNRGELDAKVSNGKLKFSDQFQIQFIDSFRTCPL